MSYSKLASPWIEILEEPKSTGLRFRYKCEGQRSGSIMGEKSSEEKKTYPTIKIHNMGPAAVIVVSCVSKSKPHYPHPNSLVGTGCDKGICTIRLKNQDTASLTNVGIQCCKRQDVKDALEERKKSRVDPFCTGYIDDVGQIDLNSVRLCFQVFLPDPDTRRFTRILTPVVSHEIVDKKLVNNLQICRLSKQAGYAKGGDELFILCDRIKKDNIEVRFFQTSDDGNTVWESKGQFSPADIHRQCAIVCTTPAYHETSIDSPVVVNIQLVRPNDSMYGHPLPFQYIPNNTESEDSIAIKKRKYNNFVPFNEGARSDANASINLNYMQLLQTTQMVPEFGCPLTSADDFQQASEMLFSMPTPTIVSMLHGDGYSSDEQQQQQQQQQQQPQFNYLPDDINGNSIKGDGWRNTFSSKISKVTRGSYSDFSTVN